MKLSDIWNEIEPLFGNLENTKEIFYLRYFYLKIKYEKEIFKKMLSFIIKKNIIFLKNFEIANQIAQNQTIDNLHNQSETTSTNNASAENTSREIYTGFSVDGDFKKNINNGTNTANNNTITKNKDNPIETYKKLNDLKKIDLIEDFLISVSTLFITFYSANI